MGLGLSHYINDMISIITRRGTTFWLLLVIAMMTAVIHPISAQTHPLLSEKQQTTDTAKPEKKGRLKWVLALHAAGMTGTYIYFIEPWWSGKKRDFNFKMDWYNNHWREIDKFGHFFANIQLSRFSAMTYRYAGIDRRKSLWYGGASSLILYTAFELTDATFDNWGFSVPDYIANILGAGYPLLQDMMPVLQHFNFKISYRKSKYFKNEAANKPEFSRYKPYEYLVGDYDGQRFWLSADADALLPQHWRKFWPNWLNIAIGYGARNLPQHNSTLKRRDVYLALDFNFPATKDDPPLLFALKSLISSIHLPAPTVRFSKDGTVFYGLFF